MLIRPFLESVANPDLEEFALEMKEFKECCCYIVVLRQLWSCPDGQLT